MDYSKVIELDPNYVDGYFCRGQANFKLEDYVSNHAYYYVFVCCKHNNYLTSCNRSWQI